MELLNITSKITPSQDKTHITHRFNIENSPERLIIEFSYSPREIKSDAHALEILKDAFEKYEIKNRKTVDFLPLKNLVTISVDSPQGYAGAAHRGESHQIHEIGENYSSSGFEKCKIQNGEWKIVLSVHCALSEINYSLKIHTGGKK